MIKYLSVRGMLVKQFYFVVRCTETHTQTMEKCVTSYYRKFYVYTSVEYLTVLCMFCMLSIYLLESDKYLNEHDVYIEIIYEQIPLQNVHYYDYTRRIFHDKYCII